MFRTLLALVALALPFPAVAQALTPAEATAIDKAVGEALAKTGAPSAEVAVVRGGTLVLSHAWGKAGETMPVARADMPYQVASNSKQFLAALMLLLEDDHKLSLDDHVAKWLPGISGGETITLRELLSHTAGLQDYWPQDYLFPTMLTPTTPEQIAARWARKPLDYAPRSRWQYSNTGYVVAGLIAEKAGSKPLWRQFEERIFRPLGIHPLPLDATNAPGFPQGYHRNALGPVRVAAPPAKGWLWAAGELSMTAAEFARWDIARLNRTLLTPQDWTVQETPVALADGTTTQYGLGVYNHIVDGRRVIDHGGESVGFLSQNSVYPDSRAAIVVLTNGDFADAPGMITKAIADIIMPKAAAPDAGETARTEDAKAELAALAAGRFEPALFTDNARYYFSPEARADYETSLGPLGAPTSFEPTRSPRLRGGFVNRNFRMAYGATRLVLVTYAEPGPHGRWEQFIVMPAE
ncbi:MAG: beta-lactamase family protein [Novosphingobium sp.]|nr:beta-lactamase family protein [Novosphingobium sp.]